MRKCGKQNTRLENERRSQTRQIDPPQRERVFLCLAVDYSPVHICIGVRLFPHEQTYRPVGLCFKG